MTNITEQFNKQQLKTDLPDIRPGDTVRIYQIIPAIISTQAKKVKKAEKTEKERIQVFEGLILARKHGKGVNATITVRKVISGIGVEKIFPLHSPLIEKIEMVKRGKARRAKLYYLRKKSEKKIIKKLKAEAFNRKEKEPQPK